jgi:hypothetical protein
MLEVNSAPRRGRMRMGKRKKKTAGVAKSRSGGGLTRRETIGLAIASIIPKWVDMITGLLSSSTPAPTPRHYTLRAESGAFLVTSVSGTATVAARLS